MITQNPAVPTEVTEQIQTLKTQVETLQRELSQAMEIWHQTLQGEKRNFAELLLHKESAWQEQEAEWLKQKQAFEQRIEDMQTEFESRLRQTEQNATRTFNELEDAWQRDKLSWQTPKPQPTPELAPEQSLAPWLEEKQTLETRIRELEARLMEVPAAVETVSEKSPLSDELLQACLHALDHQIEVLYDLVQHHSQFAYRESLS